MKAAGASEEVAAESVQAVRDRSTATVRDAEVTDTMSRDFPEVLVRRVGEATRDIGHRPNWGPRSGSSAPWSREVLRALLSPIASSMSVVTPHSRSGPPGGCDRNTLGRRWTRQDPGPANPSRPSVYRVQYRRYLFGLQGSRPSWCALAKRREKRRRRREDSVLLGFVWVRVRPRTAEQGGNRAIAPSGRDLCQHLAENTPRTGGAPGALIAHLIAPAHWRRLIWEPTLPAPGRDSAQSAWSGDHTG